MVRKKYTDDEIEKITGATRHETINVPFYYAPPFLKDLQRELHSRLSSSGGRPTFQDAKLVRKVRFTKKDWRKLKILAQTWSRTGKAVTPAQVAGTIVEKFLSTAKNKG